MDLIIWGKLGIILLLVAGNAFFVGSEIAITSARRSRIKQLADLGNKSAKVVQILHQQPERFYSVTQIGITLVSLALGAIGMVTISDLLDPSFEGLFALFGPNLVKAAHTTSYVMAFIIISFLHVVAGELAPKVLAFHKAEAMSMGVGWIINLLYVSWKPVIWLMNKASNGLLWVFGQRDLGGDGHEGHFSMSEEEIRMILNASEQDGVLHPDETKMIRGVFDLDEHSVREAMIPRTEILALRHDATLLEAVRKFKNAPHARFPVYEGSFDNIIGIVSIKEMLGALADSQDLQSQSWQRSVKDFLHEPYMIPNSKSLSGLLKEFRKNRQQMAIVVDEYGGTEGIITLEDILEEIVGDYADEFTPQARRVKKLEGSQYEIDASMRVSDLEPLVNFPFDPSEDYVTLGGLVYKELGRIPKVGDHVDMDAGRLEVMEMDNHRITKIKFMDVEVKRDGSINLTDSKSKADLEIDDRPWRDQQANPQAPNADLGADAVSAAPPAEGPGGTASP